MAFRMTTSEHNGGVRVAVAGELDLATAPELEGELLRLLADPRGTRSAWTCAR